VVAIFALVSWSLSTAIYPDLAGGYSSLEYWATGVATAALFFASLLAHELSHSVVSRRLGIGVRDITLWLFGGVSRIEGEAHSPHDEMKLALAGPAMSFAIAGGSVSTAIVLSGLDAPFLLVGSVAWLGAINLVLGVFNLVPASPLDGGRVLHAWLWHRNGSRWRAGVTAARAGRNFGWVLIALGALEFATLDAIGGLWIMVLGWFLVMAARAEEAHARLTHDLEGVRVRDVMTQQMFAVDDELLAGAPNASPNELLLDVLYRVGDASSDRVLVVERGRGIGVVFPADVARIVEMAETRRADWPGRNGAVQARREGAE
jgi:Zn-dependent protease